MTSSRRTPHGRERGRARHRHAALPRAPEGPRDVDVPGRIDLCVHARPAALRRPGGERGAQGWHGVYPLESAVAEEKAERAAYPGRFDGLNWFIFGGGLPDKTTPSEATASQAGCISGY